MGVLDVRRRCTNEYGNRDYTGSVEPCSHQHVLMCRLLGYVVSVFRGQYIFNGLARFLTVLRPSLGVDRENVECFYAYIWTSRRAAGAFRYMCGFHIRIMELGVRGYGPLAYLARQAALEDTSDEGM
jgi:hypothetical protein